MCLIHSVFYIHILGIKNVNISIEFLKDIILNSPPARRLYRHIIGIFMGFLLYQFRFSNKYISIKMLTFLSSVLIGIVNM